MKQIRRWDLWGLAAGLLLGTGDMAALFFFGADLSIAGRDIAVPLTLSIVLTYAALGYMAGRVAQGRARAWADAATIKRQIEALETSQREVLQSEKLAS